MSIQATLVGVPQRATPVALTNTSITDVFVGEAADIRHFVGCTLINTTGSPITVSLYRFDATGNYRFWRASVPANDTVNVTDVMIPTKTTAHGIRAEGANGLEVYPFVMSQGKNG